MRKTQEMRRTLTQEEATSIALARFSGWPQKSVAGLAEQFNRDPAVISRAIAKAFQEKLVLIVRNRESNEEIDQVKQILRDRFDRLTQCIIVDHQATSSSSIGDDALHQSLGQAMADIIARGAMFRHKDIIGLGSGRGVYYTIVGLRAYEKLRVEVKLVSLTGDVYAQTHEEPLNILLDADQHLNLMGRRFARPITLVPLSHRIAYPDSTKLQEILDDTHLNSEKWKAEGITHAITGVGVLSSGHRFHTQTKVWLDKKKDSIRSKDLSDVSNILAPLKDFLIPLVEICEKVENESEDKYCPVADICNRLFFVPPPHWYNLSDTLRQEIEKNINEINQRVVTVSTTQLEGIDNIILVAGGRKKALAIRHLLFAKYPIRFLCTDLSTAQIIIENI